MALRAVKRAAERVIGLAAPAIWRRLPGPALVVLTYHRVLPDGHPDRATEQPGMYVRPETLAMHLATIKEHFEPVHLDDWLEARAAGRSLPRLACAITFDDGWRDNYEFAFPLLVEAAVPATVFLVTSFIGGHYSFWPNRLARQLTRTDRRLELADWPEPLRQRLIEAGVLSNQRTVIPSPDTVDTAIGACKAFSDAEMHEFLDQLPGIDGSAADRDLLNADEILDMATRGSVRFGSHTRRHTRLGTGTAIEAMRDEVIGSADDLERMGVGRPRLFCYPNGDFTPDVLALVRDHYLGGAATARGWNGADANACLIHRVGLHEDVAGRRTDFLARLELAR